MVHLYCSNMEMKLVVDKTLWKVGNSGKKLEKTMTAKYLGIKIRVRGKHLIDREKDVIASARRFAHSIFSLLRKGWTDPWLQEPYGKVVPSLPFFMHPWLCCSLKQP